MASRLVGIGSPVEEPLRFPRFLLVHHWSYWSNHCSTDHDRWFQVITIDGFE
jgi:hypothetical protein